MNRNKLILDNMKLAEDIARSKKRQVPRFISYRELLSAAYLGLVDAADRYDKKKATDGADNSFERYARKRIKGSVSDLVRSLSWGTRVHKITPISIEYYCQGSDSGDENLQIKNKAVAKDRPIVDDLNCADIINKVMNCLSPRDRKVFILRFVYDYSMGDIAREVDTTEGRVSQLIASQREYLRKVWKSRKDELLEEISG